MSRRVPCLVLCAVVLAFPPHAHAQSAPESAGSDLRYRWAQKVDTTLAAQPAAAVTVPAMLTWTPLDLGPRDVAAPRQGRELHVYRLTGWIRRARQNDDGDVHLSLTATPGDSPDSCVVVEIPAERYGAVFRRARADLLPALEGTRIKRSGRLTPPVAVEVTGAAFFDGKHLQHRKIRGTKDQGAAEAKSHGDCNASASALWEIHPAYRIRRP